MGRKRYYCLETVAVAEAGAPPLLLTIVRRRRRRRCCCCCANSDSILNQKKYNHEYTHLFTTTMSVGVAVIAMVTH